MDGNGYTQVAEASDESIDEHFSRRCVWSVGRDVEANGIGKDVIEALGARDVDALMADLAQILDVRKREIGKPYVVGLAFVKMTVSSVSIGRHR